MMASASAQGESLRTLRRMISECKHNPSPVKMSEMPLGTTSGWTIDDTQIHCESLSTTRITDRTDTELPPYGWLKDEQVMQEFRPSHWADILGEKYGLMEIEFHLVSFDRPVTTFLFSIRNRFFVWKPDQDSLDHVVTPYNLFGLYRAFDRNESLRLHKLQHRVDRNLLDPTRQDILPCRPENKPVGWTDDPAELIENHSFFSLKSWGITNRQPILSYDSRDGADDMQFFFAHGRYYLYWQMAGKLRAILHPDMSDESNWKLLAEVPKFQSFRLARVSLREIEGGRRTIKQSEIPPGWEQPREMIDPSVYIRGSGTLQPTSLLRRISGRDEVGTQIVEDNDVVRIWEEGTRPDNPTVLEGKGGLPNVLDNLRHQHLASVEEDNEG